MNAYLYQMANGFSQEENVTRTSSAKEALSNEPEPTVDETPSKGNYLRDVLGFDLFGKRRDMRDADFSVSFSVSQGTWDGTVDPEIHAGKNVNPDYFTRNIDYIPSSTNTLPGFTVDVNEQIGKNIEGAVYKTVMSTLKVAEKSQKLGDGLAETALWYLLFRSPIVLIPGWLLATVENLQPDPISY